MCQSPIAPAARRQVAKSNIDVAVIAPDDLFQHPERPVQKAQNVVIKLFKNINFLIPNKILQYLFYLFINYNTITNYILIIFELSNFNHMLGVVSQTRVSGGNRTHDPHANSLALN